HHEQKQEKRNESVGARLHAVLTKSSESTRSSASTTRTASSSENDSGGFILTTLWSGPSVESRMPWSFIRSTTYAARAAEGVRDAFDSTSSRPRKRPRPRASPAGS